MSIYDQVYDALDNAAANEYPHEFDMKPLDVVEQINDWSGIVGFDPNDSQHMSDGENAVFDWRRDNPQ